MLIQRGKEVVVTPDQAEIVRQGDVLILAGSDENLEQFMAETKKHKAEE